VEVKTSEQGTGGTGLRGVLEKVYVRTGVLRPETGGSGAFLRSLPSRIYGQSWLSFDRMHNELMSSDEPTSIRLEKCLRGLLKIVASENTWGRCTRQHLILLRFLSF